MAGFLAEHTSPRSSWRRGDERGLRVHRLALHPRVEAEAPEVGEAAGSMLTPFQDRRFLPFLLLNFVNRPVFFHTWSRCRGTWRASTWAPSELRSAWR